jgi:hypothetical protein
VDGGALELEPGEPDPGVFSVGVGTAAMAPVGLPDAVPRCWSSIPPIPNAMVARTRFRRPRLRTRRAR